MTDEENVQQDAPEQGTQQIQETQETPEQQAQREEAEGQLADESGEQQDSQQNGDDSAAKKKSRVQKRIDELTKKASESERRRQEAERKLAEYQKQEASQPPADDPRPSYDAYDSIDEWEKDLESWARRQAQRESQAAPEQSLDGPSPEDQEAIERVENAAVEAIDRYPDFDDVVRDPNLPLTTEMVRAAAETDSPADVLYYIGQHREEASRLAQKSGTSLVREIGRIEATLENQQSAQPKQAESRETGTSAPEPIQTVGGSRARREPSPDEMSIDEWMRWRQEQLENRS